MSQFTTRANLISTLNPYSAESIGHRVRTFADMGLQNTASAAWPSANLGIYIPCWVRSPVKILQAYWYDGATLSGNVDVGLFTGDGTKICSTGSTAQSGGTINTRRVINITDVQIGTGKYYLAMAASSGTATFFAVSATITVLHEIAMGIKQQASALALPATWTPAQIAFVYIPVFGFTTRTVI